MLYKHLFLASSVGALSIPADFAHVQQAAAAAAPYRNSPQSIIADSQPAKVETIAAQHSPEATRKLTGRILHISDIHPDPYYKTYASTDAESTCHRGKGVAGYYGAESSDCDSPFSLVNATFDWLKANLRDEVDFIIWTGDSARHDNDPRIPRSRNQVTSLNEFVVTKFLDAFGKKENWDDDDPTNDFVVPIVPTFGNNDILPHNIFLKGPNSWTMKYLDIWRQFIPAEERHEFARGGWFSIEVIPHKLAVFSLNTLYFFSSNGAVDGCAGKRDPGYQQFDWLRIQLDRIRSRGMKAILMGHVPPARVEAKVSWDETCWQKYTLWMHQYRDVIVAGLYGHMNIDHFMLQDYEDVKKHVRKGIEYLDEEPAYKSSNTKDELTVDSAQDYLQSLRSVFAQIPTIASNKNGTDVKNNGKSKEDRHRLDYKEIGGHFGKRYSLTLVAPSVVPNYFPAIRVYSYNISGLDDIRVPDSSYRPTLSHDSSLTMEPSTEPNSQQNHHLELRSLSNEDDSQDVIQPATERTDRARRSVRFTVPHPPSKSTPPGPAYSAQSLTLLSYTQYFANLTYINNDFTHELPEESDDELEGKKWKHGKHHGKKPKHPKPHPLNLTFDVEYDTARDKAYGLRDLTTRSMLDLAARIAGKTVKKHDINLDDDISAEKKKHKKHKKHRKHKKHDKKDKTWLTFLNRAFVGVFNDEELDDMY